MMSLELLFEETNREHNLPADVFDALFKLNLSIDDIPMLMPPDHGSKEHLEDLKNVKSVCILIGPEGDFSPAERELILQNRAVKPFTLSRNILRSDTAVISAISLVNFINNFH